MNERQGCVCGPAFKLSLNFHKAFLRLLIYNSLINHEGAPMQYKLCGGEHRKER